MFKPGDKIRRIKGSGYWDEVHEGDVVTFKKYDSKKSIKIFEFNELVAYSTDCFELVSTNQTFKIFI